MLPALAVLVFFGGVILLVSAVIAWMCSAIMAVLQTLRRAFVAAFRRSSHC